MVPRQLLSIPLKTPRTIQLQEGQKVAVWLWEPGRDRVRCLTGARSPVITPSHSVLLICVPVRRLCPGPGPGPGGVRLLVSGPTVLPSSPGVKTALTPVYYQTLPVLQLSVNAHNLTSATLKHKTISSEILRNI